MMSYLDSADSMLERSKSSNTLMGLYHRGGEAARDAAKQGLQFCEIPVENIEPEVSERFIRQLTQKGFTLEPDWIVKENRRIAILRISW
jgi:hypothetical protein